MQAVSTSETEAGRAAPASPGTSRDIGVRVVFFAMLVVVAAAVAIGLGLAADRFFITNRGIPTWLLVAWHLPLIAVPVLGIWSWMRRDARLKTRGGWGRLIWPAPAFLLLAATILTLIAWPGYTEELEHRFGLGLICNSAPIWFFWDFVALILFGMLGSAALFVRAIEEAFRGKPGTFTAVSLLITGVPLAIASATIAIYTPFENIGVPLGPCF
jgi:hypothetical protein